MTLPPIPVAALSLTPPHGDLIAIGEKTIETRLWSTKYRGWLLICNSKRRKDNEEKINESIEAASDKTTCEDVERDYPLLTSGYIPRYSLAVALVWLKDVKKLKDDKETRRQSCVGSPEDLFGFYLEDLLPIDPFEIKGKQRIFEVKIPPSRVRQIPYCYRDPLRRNIRVPKPDPKRMPFPVFTIGYAGRTPEEISELQQRYESVLIDVRRKPYSKNAPFQKENLEKYFGDTYQSKVNLGNAKFCLPWRRLPQWEQDMGQVAKILHTKSVMLLCGERFHYQCHRREVALFLSAITGSQVIHL